MCACTDYEVVEKFKLNDEWRERRRCQKCRREWTVVV